MTVYVLFLRAWRAPVHRIFDQKHASYLQNKFQVSWLFQEAIYAQITNSLQFRAGRQYLDWKFTL